MYVYLYDCMFYFVIPKDDVSSIRSESIVSDCTPSSSLTGLQTEIYSYTPATKEFSAGKSTLH